MKDVVRVFWYAVCGLGCGLCLAFGGVTDPAAIKGALDPFGDFDPRVPVFFVGAVCAYYPLQRLALGRGRPWFAGRFYLPIKTLLEVRLVVGSALFGIGWAVSGICPAPATVNLGTGAASSAWYFMVLVGGLYAGRLRALDLRTLVRSLGSRGSGGRSTRRGALSQPGGPRAQR